MSNSIILVNIILERLHSNKIQSITHLKLQKLVYYCQAWTLVFANHKLFEDKIEAWVHGPVVPSVYYFLRNYGFSQINDYARNFSYPSKYQEIIYLICDNYGNKDGIYLENLSHSEFPWIKARCGLSSVEKSNNIISEHDMKSYYSNFVDSYSPPKISKYALDIKQTLRSSNLQSFVDGVGSALLLHPTTPMTGATIGSALKSLKCRHPGYISDAESLMSDWDKIGADMRNALDKAVLTL